MQMIVYIGLAQPDEWPQMAAVYARHAQRFEQAAGGLPCLLLPFTHATPPMMDHLAPRAVVMSGAVRNVAEYDVRGFFGLSDWVRETRTPTLAICGSHQLLGFFFNQDVRRLARIVDEPMRPHRPGEPVANADYHPDYFMERGFYPLELREAACADSLFEGVGPTAYVCESHYCEIKILPPGFELLASTPDCRIQAMRHQSRPLYGVQFHPEDYTDHFPAGKRLLENFFRLAQSRK